MQSIAKGLPHSATPLPSPFVCSRRHNKRVVHWRPNRSLACNSYTTSQEWREANPSFDEVELDEQYYESLGITADELAEQLSFLASDTDPEGEDLTPESLSQAQAGTSSFLLDEELDAEAWGLKASSLHLCL